ncbi:MAG: hypothetical protein KKB51_01610 [Candidatus Riflebacteria bacterium]|nr:hypothetical protein [Candidatus Riflebacteria bacterium]
MEKENRECAIFRVRQLLLFFVFLLAFSGVARVCAQGSKDLRTIVLSEVSSNWPQYSSTHNIEYTLTFPINGGKISGSGREIYHFQVPVEFSKADGRATKTEPKEANYTFGVQGQFSGGDGGTLTGKIIPNQTISGESRNYNFSGKLWANGKGKITISDNEFDVTFTPYGECCNKNLNSYSKAIREILIQELMDQATPYMHAKMLKIVERGMKFGYSLAQRIFNAGKALYEAVRTKINRIATGRFSLPPLNPEAGFLKKLNDAFGAARKARSAGPIHPLIMNMTDNIEKCLSILQTLDAGSDGAYGEAGFAAAAGAISAYSNLAGLALALGQAAKEDWDGFCETNYESEFRKYYCKIYFESGQVPSERIGRAGQQARLKDFMEYFILNLTSGNVASALVRNAGGEARYLPGGAEGARLQNMLIDFAHYKLNLSKSKSDFALVEKKDKLVLASRADASVLAALFQAYEQVFLMDLEAERVRKASIKRYSEDKKEIRNILSGLTQAEIGNFDDVWPKAEYNDIFCEMYHRLEKMGKLKEAGK